MPSFDLSRPFDGPSPDLVVTNQDFADCHELYGISTDGKNFIAYLQEVDDVEPLGNWSCRISRRDFDAYGFDLARGRGLRLCCYRDQGDHLEFGELIRNDS